MQIFIVKVEVKRKGELKSSYVDSVWENKQDAEEHVVYCLNKDIFNNDWVPEIIEEHLNRHFNI